MTRKVHLRPNAVIWQGRTKTFCGKPLWVLDGAELTAAVTSFDGLDATVHGTLVTCARCLEGTKHRQTGSELER